MAICRAGAAAKKMPLYKYIAALAEKPTDNFVLPVPSFNVINGGTHAGNRLACQEFMILPTGASSFKEAMQIGAADYLNKPFEDDEIEVVIQQVLEKVALEHERDRLASEVIPSGDSIVWVSDAMRNVRAILEQVSETDVTILIHSRHLVVGWRAGRLCYAFPMFSL